MIKKGIILAGGKGTRQYPNTIVTSKLLLPIYDKPAIYYPLSTLINAGLNQILLITSPRHIAEFKELFGDGSQLGIELHYAEQVNPEGIAQSFVIGKDFIGRDGVCLMLGDNLISSDNLNESLENALIDNDGATIFAHRVKDPTQYGVVEFDNNRKAISIEEKPEIPKSNYAVSGLYFYPNDVVGVAKNQKPSPRGELEITDVNRYYLDQERLTVEVMGRGYAWLDTGTQESLLEASQFVQILEKRQGIKISCLEEIAYRMGFIDNSQLRILGNQMESSSYGQYLLKISNGNL